VGVQTLVISAFPFGSPRTKCHSDVALWRGTKYTIRGKVVASPKSWPWWVLWVRVCPWWVLWVGVCPWWILWVRVCLWWVLWVWVCLWWIMWVRVCLWWILWIWVCPWWVMWVQVYPWWVLWVQVCPWWNLWIWICPWWVLAPKVLQLCINHLVFSFVQVSVSSWCLSLFLVPSRSSSMPSLNLSRSLGACHPTSISSPKFEITITCGTSFVIEVMGFL